MIYVQQKRNNVLIFKKDIVSFRNKTYGMVEEMGASMSGMRRTMLGGGLGRMGVSRFLFFYEFLRDSKGGIGL